MLDIRTSSENAFKINPLTLDVDPDIYNLSVRIRKLRIIGYKPNNTCILLSLSSQEAASSSNTEGLH